MADQAEDTHNGGKLPMPRFSGEGQSGSAISLDAELFLGRFEDWTQVCNYANERKAKALGYALTKAAATWYQQTCRRRQVDTNSWADIRAAFSTRFMKKVSPRYIATELNQLTQRHKESVADFLDRCELAQTLLDDQWKVEAGATHRAERQETLTLVHEKLVLHHFLRHLRSDISEKLAFCPDLESLDDHVKAAERIEKAESDRQHKAPLATMSEVNAFQPARQQQSQQQQKKKKQPGPNYLCRLCGVAGHFIGDCPKSEKQQKRGGKGRPQQQQQHPPAQRQHQQAQFAQQGAVPRSYGQQQQQQQPVANYAPTHGYHQEAQQQQQAYFAQQQQQHQHIQSGPPSINGLQTYQQHTAGSPSPSEGRFSPGSSWPHLPPQGFQ